MPHVSPSSMLLWSILVVVEFVYLFVHLWRYDRLQCLRWNSGNSPGAFKRCMTYGYMISVPSIGAFAMIMAKIKYEEGYMDLTRLGLGVRPKPHELWSQTNQDWLLPAYICLSVGWALEITSHLEELAFWLFLLNQGQNTQSWFSSMEFWGWVSGSAVAIGGLPTLVVLLRNDMDHAEAWLFLAGGVGSFLITMWSGVILYKFPGFLRKVRQEGADPEVVVRLTTFNELNRIRVAFRLIFVCPLIVLAVDGVLPVVHHTLNENQLVVDLCTSAAAIGCIVSSILTLLIFFPRSIAKEAGYNARTISERSPGSRRSSRDFETHPDSRMRNLDGNQAATPTSHMPLSLRAVTPGHGHLGGASAAWEMDELRRPPHQVELGYNTYTEGYVLDSQTHLTDDKYNGTIRLELPSRPPRRPETGLLHPIILNYTSPLDLVETAPVGPQRPRPRGPGHF